MEVYAAQAAMEAADWAARNTFCPTLRRLAQARARAAGRQLEDILERQTGIALLHSRSHTQPNGLTK
jgi:hypothetical protein